MEDVAVMNPIIIGNDDDDDDISINLDLVLDNDESEESAIKKVNADVEHLNGKLVQESEEDILNKYIADSPGDIFTKKADLPSEDAAAEENNGLDTDKKENDNHNGTDNEIICNGYVSSEDSKSQDKNTHSDNKDAEPSKQDGEDIQNGDLPESDKIVCNGFTEEHSNDTAESHHSNQEDVPEEKLNGDEEEEISIAEVDDENSNEEVKSNENTKSTHCDEDSHDSGKIICNGDIKDKEEESSDNVENAKEILDIADETEISKDLVEVANVDIPLENTMDMEIENEIDDVDEVMDLEENVNEEANLNENNVDNTADKSKVDEKLASEEEKNSEQEIDDNKKPDDAKDSESADTVKTQSAEKEANEKSSRDDKTDETEDEDLLLVLDEKSVDDAEEETKDENSCSSSEKDEESRENNATPQIEGNCEEEITESQDDVDIESGECPMDIEENDIGTIFSEHSLSKDESTSDSAAEKAKLQREDSITIDIEENILCEVDREANKENEDTAMNKENKEPKSTAKETSDKDTADTVVTNGISSDVEMVDQDNEKVEIKSTSEDLKKTNKRQLSDSSEEDNAKKIRLEDAETPEVEKPPEKVELKKLSSLKQFMLDKNLKSLTRFELEELCIQKMCECIVNKSEIGELRQKIKVQEQAIDTWRKEAVVVAKQTRDLKIVFERLMADLKAIKEQSGKPLVPVKITRSVGLQAIIENTARRPVMNGATTPQRHTVPNTPKPTTPVRPQPKKLVPPRPVINKPLQPVGQKDNVNVNTPKQRPMQPSPQVKKNQDPKAVIDLTDEDEKNQAPKTATTTASPTVRVVNKANTNNANSKVATNIVSNTTSPKILVMSPNLSRPGQVMLKVSQANGVIPSVQNGQVSLLAASQPVVRTVQQVRVANTSTATVRTTPAKPNYKHPAPLPAAPISQQTIVARKPIPPKPHLNLTRSSCGTGIVLQWKMPYKLDIYESIVSYQLYAYQETKSPPRTDNWGKIGDVKALELPMAVTLTQFAVGNRYYFAVRAVDVQKRLGPFSEPQTILL